MQEQGHRIATQHGQLYARSAGGEVVILPGCHHMPQREYPEPVLAAVQRFLRDQAK